MRDASRPEATEVLYSATFTFAKGEYDDEFYRLDDAIAGLARELPGYMGEEAWENPEKGLISNVYYWNDLDALRTLMEHPLHREAKAQQARWLNGFQVVIAQVLAAYGDERIEHPLRGRIIGNRALK